MSATTVPPNLPKLEAQLLRDEAGGSEPRLTLRTQTRVDTGRWLKRSRLWLCVIDDDVVLLAASKRRYFEKITLADCRDSYYSHPTGQLVLEPLEAARYKQIQMSPTDALRFLELIQQSDLTPHPPQGNATENRLA